MDWLLALLMAWHRVADEIQPVIELARLDHVRAEAYASGDPTLLDRVYLKGSVARREDADTIGSYRARGARVVGAELEILEWMIVKRSDEGVTLEIVDRLASSEVEWNDGRRTILPRDLPTRRTITLVKNEHGWRIT